MYEKNENNNLGPTKLICIIVLEGWVVYNIYLSICFISSKECVNKVASHLAYRPFAEGCGPPTHRHLGVKEKNGSFVLYTECTKLQASFYGRNFCWETFRPIFYKDKGLIQQFIKVCKCSFVQKDRKRTVNVTNFFLFQEPPRSFFLYEIQYMD